MTDKILFVDDDPNILNAIKRQLRRQFTVETAVSGQEGLNLLSSKGPFAVVVADMRMPKMDGIQFLRSVQEDSPQSIRLMLTGNADQQTAIDAVNEGNVFRFLNKPCHVKLLVKALEAALEQYRLVHAERELLDGTVNGSIKLLTEILSAVAPNVFDRAVALREVAGEVALALRIMHTWDMDMATMLSHIAYVTLPPETLAKVRSGITLSPAEETIVAHLPETGHRLLENIPRLEKVARIVLYQAKNFDGSGFPKDKVAGEDIPLESRILKILHDLRDLEERDVEAGKAMERMKQSQHRYDPRVFQTVAWFLSADKEESNMLPPTDVLVADLRPDQVLVSNVETESGQLLITAGHKLTSTMVAKLLHYHELHRIKQPIQVSSPQV